MKYIDIGCNLFCHQFEGKEDRIVENAHTQDVHMIITGSSIFSSSQAASYVSCKTDIWSTAGVHPHDAKSCDDHTIDILRNLILNNSNVVAVGECGLDYDRMYSPKDIQLKYFKEQVKLAVELNKPLFLHEREAFEDMYSILSEYEDLKAVIHCFTGNRKMAEKYLELGCYIGITGWVCDDRRNQDVLDALAIIPADRLMVETDAPYLLPRKIKGLKNPNVPENIRYVVEKIAMVKGLDPEEFRKTVLGNTIRFFQLYI